MKAFPKDITPQTMTVRHIGVENELLVHGGATNIREAISRRGILHSIGSDGGGHEFRTHPISVRSLKQVRGFRYLCEYYEELEKNTTVIDSGGTHIHISILQTDHPNMEVNATAMGIAFFRQFQKIAGRDTHWAQRFRGNTTSQVRTTLDECRIRGRVYTRIGRMLGPTGHQTLEFRGPKGSNSKDEILAWVEFVDNVVKLANRESVEGIAFKRLLRGKRISAYIDGLPSNRKLTDAELNQKFNGAALVC